MPGIISNNVRNELPQTPTDPKELNTHSTIKKTALYALACIIPSLSAHPAAILIGSAVLLSDKRECLPNRVLLTAIYMGLGLMPILTPLHLAQPFFIMLCIYRFSGLFIKLSIALGSLLAVRAAAPTIANVVRSFFQGRSTSETTAPLIANLMSQNSPRAGQGFNISDIESWTDEFARYSSPDPESSHSQNDQERASNSPIQPQSLATQLAQSAQEVSNVTLNLVSQSHSHRSSNWAQEFVGYVGEVASSAQLAPGSSKADTILEAAWTAANEGVKMAPQFSTSATVVGVAAAAAISLAVLAYEKSTSQESDKPSEGTSEDEVFHFPI